MSQAIAFVNPQVYGLGIMKFLVLVTFFCVKILSVLNYSGTLCHLLEIYDSEVILIFCGISFLSNTSEAKLLMLVSFSVHF